MPAAGTPGAAPSVDHVVRLKRDASSRPTGTGEVKSAPAWDAGGVSDPAAEPIDGGSLPSDTAEGWVAPSWEQVVRDHSARVYRLAYRLSGNAQDAEDLTQETFVRVFRSLAEFSPGTFEGWLHRITTNLFLDMVRRRQRIRFDALPDDTERLPGRAPSPEQVYADTHLDPQIQAALDALSPEFRVAVVLCDIEGLTYEEIAATLGIKLGTVRSRIHRGRVQLRQALAHLAPRRITAQPDADGVVLPERTEA
jgi:RNA polymerase sigma factor (sigma-70 family)